MAFGHFRLGSHGFMATALHSCVKWALVARKQLPTPKLEGKPLQSLDNFKPCQHQQLTSLGIRNPSFLLRATSHTSQEP